MRATTWRHKFAEIVRKCWEYAKKFPKGQRRDAYRECWAKYR